MYREEKKFAFILFSSLTIHVIFILILPGFRDIVVEKEKKVMNLKFGYNIVNTKEELIKSKDEKELSKKTAKVPEKNIPKIPENLEKKEVEERKIEKVVEKKDKNVLNFKETLNLEDLQFDEPEFDLLSSENISNIKTVKKDIRGMETELDDFSQNDYANSQSLSEELEEVKEVIPTLKSEVFTENYKVDTKTEDESLKWVSFKDESGVNPNLPEGFKLGTLEEGLVPVWSKSNKEPEYPLEAEKNGMKGKVTAILDVDESGKVRIEKIEKSGYSILDRAVEKVAKTWKIFIFQNDLPVSGKVSVTYDFELKSKK